PDKESYVNYRELAPKIIDYVKKMGYTHIELMPVMEHPFDGSWGYQVIGYYAPTARYGTPEDFMYFMNEMHKAGIGVILDWVPAHFPRDVHGLSNFDGTCLYEHLDPRQGSHPDWGTLIYNYGRPQVSNYLIANALFWINKYHADGLRMDAVASMLYLDYGKQDGQWVANMYGGNENLEAMEFLKHLNSIVAKTGRGAVCIAEESTAWPMVTGHMKEGGLGFSYKWNMGWMNDYLQYIKYDPFFRAHHHGELTFSMIYAYSEKFILEFSHDEVVHGKGSLIGKMPGERPEKFANLRLTFGHMMMHPGRKLLFMGQDIGEFDEWNEEREVEWDLLQYPEHQGVNRLMADLNHMYREQPALYALDSDKDGFEWINSISANECVLVFLRKSAEPGETLLVVENFANVERKDYKIGVPFAGKYKEILSTDAKIYGGQGIGNPRVKVSKTVECDDRENSIQIRMAPLSVHVFSCTPYTEEELLEIQKMEVEKQMEALKKEVEKKEAEKAALEKKVSAKKTVASGKTPVKKAPQKKASAKKAPKEKTSTKKVQEKKEK
ncbi:MAG: 1,4-alpha-glucan branching protein GlgB, partial [Lachnospiraceae bacterium]